MCLWEEYGGKRHGHALKRKSISEKEVGKGTGVGERKKWVFHPKVFYLLSKSRDLRIGPREDFNEIFISFLGVSLRVVVSTDWLAPGEMVISHHSRS